MRTPSPPYCRLDLAPPLADRFIVGVAPIDYGPVVLLMPFGFHLAMDTLPSRELRKRCPTLSGQRGITPAFGYGAPHPGARGTSTLLNNVLLSTQYGPVRLPTEPSQGYAFPSSVGRLAPTTRPGLPGSSTDLSPRAVPNHPGEPGGCSRPFLHHQ
jgi:hypothetical protein